MEKLKSIGLGVLGIVLVLLAMRLYQDDQLVRANTIYIANQIMQNQPRPKTTAPAPDAPGK